MSTIAVVLLAVVAADAAAPKRPAQPVATYSIVARDPATGQLGVGVQSHWFAVGSVVTWAEAGVGAVATQSFSRAAYGPELLEDLRNGLAPEAALERRTAADDGRAVRQIGVVDATGRVASYTGASCIASASGSTGDGFAVQANLMRDDGVVPAMVAAYTAAEGDLLERLLQALEGAERAGGDIRGRQSAAILIVDGKRQPERWQGKLVDLRVDDHPAPLTELRRLAQVQRAYQAANAGDEQLATGNLDGALTHYARAEELLPEQVELSYWRGITLLDSEQPTAAFPILERVFAREPAWVELAPRLKAAGHLKADDAVLQKVAALAAGTPTVRSRVAGVSRQRLESDIRTLARFGTRHTLSETESAERGIGAARRWLRDELQRISDQHHGGRLAVELVAHRVAAGERVPDGAEVVNVVATLPGQDPDRLVVISGHYDSRATDPMDATSDAPGANDDASGTAAVLEAARLAGGLQPRATVVFMAVAGEEQGLLGAKAQAATWLAAGKEVVAMVTMDIVGGATGSSGRREPWRLRAFSIGQPTTGAKVVGSDNDSASRQLARYFERAAEAAVPGFDITLIFRQDRYLRGGDHVPFDAAGWPAVRVTEPHENYAWQHQDVREAAGIAYGDRPENVDFGYVARVTGAVAATAFEVALAPPSPTAVGMDVSGLTPHTRLAWQPAAGASAYAVLQRATHEPTWTQRLVVGAKTEVTVELSKDDWLFAVEAIDAAGNRSLPVYPTPKK